MPGRVPAQQYGEDAAPAEFPGSAEFPAPDAPDSFSPEEPAPPGMSRETGPLGAAEQSAPDADAAGDPAAEAPKTGEPDEYDSEEYDSEDGDGPRPLGLHVEPTGHEPVDAQLRRLEDADHLAVSGHLEVYEDVHRGLRDTLTALDRNAPGPGPGHAPGPVPGRGVPGRPYPRS